MESVTKTLPRTRLVGKHEVAEGTMSFFFEKPTGFVYTAGQFADFTLLNTTSTDIEGNTRGFSLASAPFESMLVATTRLRGTSFKNTLRDMAAGTELEIDGPYGSFTLHHNVSRPAVFLTGGVGVTPVRSIMLQVAHDNLDRTIVVIDSNRRPEDAPFLDEMSAIAAENGAFRYVPTMTQIDSSTCTWSGEVGIIDSTMIAKHVGDLNLPLYYLSGPAHLVSALRDVLDVMGVDSDDIRTEEFSGYK